MAEFSYVVSVSEGAFSNVTDTCVFPTITGQTVCCEKGIHLPI